MTDDEIKEAVRKNPKTAELAESLLLAYFNNPSRFDGCFGVGTTVDKMFQFADEFYFQKVKRYTQ